jgi:5'-3' exonuclease
MKVHLVDGTYELFRAFFGAPPARSPSGREVGAARGLARSLLNLLSDPQVTHLGVAFDHVIESFRNDMFAGYKTSEGMEPTLLDQFPLAEQVTRALGLVTWPMIEFEADDAIGTWAARAAALPEVTQVLICSPDKDFGQCVQGQRVVLCDRMRNKINDEAGVLEKFGVRPASIPDWLALVGDTADGIPGIARWGAKSAASVLFVYDHLEHIPDRAEQWSVQVRGSAVLAGNLAVAREEARLYRELARLRLDVPLSESLEDLAWRGVDEPALRSLAEELGDSRLLELGQRTQAARGM